MGMKNLKGGEVCSTMGGHITAEGVYTYTMYEDSLLCNSLQYSFVLE